MGLRNGKSPKHIGYKVSNLINVPISYSNGPAIHIENISIGLIDYQLICNKYHEVSGAVKYINLDVFQIG